MNYNSVENFQAVIFARGGSKGVPNKNIRDLGGKPLIAHSIECALRCPSLGKVVVSTDSEEIAEISKQHGADVPFMRPENLATDQASEFDAWRHAIDCMETLGQPMDYLVSLPATSPFRVEEDVENCISVMRKNPQADAIVTVTEAARNPYFNQVAMEADSSVSIVMQNGNRATRRQDAPKVMDVTTVCYVVRTDFIKSSTGLFEGKVMAHCIPAERSLDIDTPFDFLQAQLLAEHKKISK